MFLEYVLDACYKMIRPFKRAKVASACFAMVGGSTMFF